MFPPRSGLVIAAILAVTASALPFAQNAQPLLAEDVNVQDSDESPMAWAADRYDGPLLPSLPKGLSPEAAIDYALHQQAVMGRTPTGWLDWAAANFNVETPAAGVAQGRLDTAILEIYEAAAIQPSAADLIAARTGAASVPLAVQAPVADWLSAVANAYAAQRPLAASIAERVADHLATDINAALVTAEEREEMTQRAADLTRATNALRARLAALAPLDTQLAAATCLAPVGADCLAYLGSSGPDTYASNPAPLPDPIAILDPGGDDTYTNAAGGANPADGFVPGNKLALAILVDVAGNDRYKYVGPVSVVQGSGSIGGVGVLIDADGDDDYIAEYTRTNVGPAMADIQYYFDGGAQGHGYGGVGVLLDAWGDDYYVANVTATQGRCTWILAQGFGGLGGLGISSDLWGTDVWAAYGKGYTGGNDCWGTGSFDAHQGLYTQGVGFYAGVGIMTDNGFGNDEYPNYVEAASTDYYAQGFGAFGGLGILADDGGNNNFVASSIATGANPTNPSLNCAFGTASLGGVGVMLTGTGVDTYLARTKSTKGVITMMEGDSDIGAGFSVFVDAGGADTHKALAEPGAGFSGQIFGRGVLHTTWNLVGFFMDAGGATDTYIPSPPGSNNNVWAFGLDR